MFIGVMLIIFDYKFVLICSGFVLLFNLIIIRIKFIYKIGCSLTQYNNITIYFENLTVGLHILYAFNTHVKFYANQILFTI